MKYGRQIGISAQQLLGSIVILCFIYIFIPDQVLGTEEREMAGKTYIAEQTHFYQEFRGVRYKVNSRVITVKFKKDIDITSQRAFEVNRGFTELRTNRLGYVDLEIPVGRNPLDVVQELMDDEAIEYAEVNTFGEYLPVGEPDDPHFPDQWHLKKTNVSSNGMTGAWDITSGSENIIIAVLDSGTDIGHQDLIGNAWINPGEDVDNDQMLVPANTDHLDNDDKDGTDNDGNGLIDDLAGWDFVNNNNNVRGPISHGTHVAGIIGAMINNGIGVAGVAGGFGLNKGTKIMAVGVGDFAPDGSILDDAIIYAADNGANVITLSLSVGSSQAIDDAIDYAVNQKGVFMDNAAGNNAGAVGYPASNGNVVAVSSTDKDDNLSSFSSRGPEIELAAPGEEIWSTQLDNNTGEGDGTSFASPQVAGLAGLLLSCDSTLTNRQLRTIMHDSAVDLGDPGKDDLYGFGRIDALSALQSVNCEAESGPELVFKYAAKLVCGIQPEADNMRLAQGFYATAINIHNPHQKEVKFHKALSLTFPPEAQRSGKIFQISDDTLKEDEALEVDCIDIKRRLFPRGFPSSYIKGFVTLTTKDELNVTAVYTSRGLEYKDCCKPEDQRNCCSGKKYKDSCRHSDRTDCCPSVRCPSCCVTVPGAHSSIDVEQIPGREIKLERPEKDPEQPDLIPLPAFPPASPNKPLHLPQNFCNGTNPDIASDVNVIVKNQGKGGAGPSVTSVEFFTPEGESLTTLTQATGSLNPNETFEHEFEIPVGCFPTQDASHGAPCSFRITVDSGSPPSVTESDEGNNTAKSVCPGIAG